MYIRNVAFVVAAAHWGFPDNFGIAVVRRIIQVRRRGQSAGTSRGLRSGPTATYVRLASVTLTVTSLSGLRWA